MRPLHEETADLAVHSTLAAIGVGQLLGAMVAVEALNLTVNLLEAIYAAR